MNTPPRFVTCRCQHCDGGIEFDASEFQAGDTAIVNCPHCQMDTDFIVPVQSDDPKPTQIVVTSLNPNPSATKPSPSQNELFSIKVTSRGAAVFFAFTTICLASILIWEHLNTRLPIPVPPHQLPGTLPEPITRITLPDATTIKPHATFQGDILKVSKNGIIVSTFTNEPTYEAATTTKYVPTGEFSPDKPVLVATKVQVGEKKIPGRKIILQQYPTNLEPAVGQTISFRAMRVGTTDFNGDTLELWDYENP